MIVRSIRLVHFEGVAEFGAKDLTARGVVDPPLPVGAPQRLVGDALRFAFLGGADDAERVVSAGRGYAHVEVGLRCGGLEMSLFRGVDRKGSHQVSLREDDGRRVTGNADDVRARLVELVGAPLDRWERATWIDAPGNEDPLRSAIVSVAPAPQRVPPAPVPAEPVPVAGAGLVAARETAERAVDALRRALRAVELAARVESETAALLEFGSRLRRERTQTAVEMDAATAERDRIRVRMRRVREYRELVAQERTAAPRRAPAAIPARAAETRRFDSASALALGSALLLCALTWVRSDRDLSRERWLGALFGAAFVVSLAGYVAVRSRGERRPARVAPPPEAPQPGPSGVEWRAALRQRFADLGDPDDPAIVDEFAKKLAALDARFEPLRRRLEQLDEAVAACDVESGRVSKVLHAPLPAPLEAATGLLPPESLADAVSRAGRLGDTVYHAAVERDALLAGGAPSVGAAVDSVRAAVRAVGDAARDPARGAEILRKAGLDGDGEVDSGVLRADEDLCVRLVDEVAALGTSVRPEPPAPREAPPPAPAPAAAADDVAATLGDVVEKISGRQFVLVQSGSAFDLRLQGSADPRPLAWPALPAEIRRRLTFALRLRRAEAALPPTGPAGDAEPRCIVLTERPETFVADADIAEFVRMVAPRIEQVIVGSAGVPPSEALAARTAVAAPAAAGEPARDVTRR